MMIKTKHEVWHEAACAALCGGMMAGDAVVAADIIADAYEKEFDNAVMACTCGLHLPRSTSACPVHG